MKIRKAQKKDLDAVCDMHYDMMIMHTKFGDPYFDNVSKKCKINYRKFIESGLNKRNRIILVAEEGSRTVGFVNVLIEVKPPVFENEKTAAVFDLVVANERRSKGIGGKLMKALFSILKKRKIRILRLEVHAKSFRGIKFYRKLGFKDHLLHLEKVIKW